MELTNCRDCDNPVSFSATRCPNCGSLEPSGPYRMNARERRRHRHEYRNDRRLVFAAIAFGAVGTAYGIHSSSGTLGAVLFGPLYGLIGVMLGIVVAGAINILRLRER